MQITGTAQPRPLPALTQTAAPEEEQQVLLILLGASLWDEEEQRQPEASLHTLPVAYLESSAPS